MLAQHVAFTTVTHTLFVELTDVLGNSQHVPVDTIDPQVHADLALDRPRLKTIRYYVETASEFEIGLKTFRPTQRDYSDVQYMHSPINLAADADGGYVYDRQHLQAKATDAGFNSFVVSPKGKVLYYTAASVPLPPVPVTAVA